MPVSSRLARKLPSMRPTVGKFWTPEKPPPADVVEKIVHQAEGVGRANAGKNRGRLDHRNDLAGHFHDNGIGVAIGHQPGERPASCHPVAARIVDHDQIDATGLLAFCTETATGTAADDRLPCGDHGAVSGQEFLAVEHFRSGS